MRDSRRLRSFGSPTLPFPTLFETTTMMSPFTPGINSMFEMDHATVNAGRDKPEVEEDPYTRYHDRHLHQVRGILDLMMSTGSGSMIDPLSAQRVFELARAAMGQWVNGVREIQAISTEEEMKNMKGEIYKHMGNPVLWVGILAHKVIRDSEDLWSKYYAGIQRADWTMPALHAHCKKNKHHHFVDIRRDGRKTYRTLRLRGLGLKKDRSHKAAKLSELLRMAGHDPLQQVMMTMEPFDQVERPRGGFVIQCADELWRRWKERRDSEHDCKRRHAALHKASAAEAVAASKEAKANSLLLMLQQAEHADSDDGDDQDDFTDDDDDYDDMPAPDSDLLPPDHATSSGAAQSSATADVRRRESDDLVIGPPTENGENEQVHMDPDNFDPEQMEREHNSLLRKRKGEGLIDQIQGHYDRFSDDEGYDVEEQHQNKRACATLCGEGMW